MMEWVQVISRKGFMTILRGLFAGDESITFNEVFLAVKKAVLTVQAVLEEVKQDVL